MLGPPASVPRAPGTSRTLKEPSFRTAAWFTSAASMYWMEMRPLLRPNGVVKMEPGGSNETKWYFWASAGRAATTASAATTDRTKSGLRTVNMVETPFDGDCLDWLGCAECRAFDRIDEPRQVRRCTPLWSQPVP